MLSAGAFDLSAQERYTDTDYKISFQIPKNSAKTKESSKIEVNFEDNSGSGAAFQFAVMEGLAAEGVNGFLTSAAGKKELEEAFLDGLKGDNADANLTVLERKDLKIAGLNAYKLTVSFYISGLKFRNASFFVSAPEHKRMYGFNVMALDKDFDSWYRNAEPAVNSFQLIKTK
jgi:hypothetical protein